MRLGPFELLQRVGQGGMGEVFAARDTRLNRSVAIKVISDEFLAGNFGASGSPTSGGPGSASRSTAAQRRFLREAQSASALNHANICTIYDVGEHDGQPYLVMELLEGETLRDLLRRENTLAVTELFAFAHQAAMALEAAHAKGIVHRDIKPANIFVVGPAGRRQIKILDFGLARQSVDQPANNEQTVLASSDSMTLTTAGSAVGTIAYMSPEQAEGLPLDERTDLFSLGCVLYEASAGRRAFDGQSPASVFAALLTRQPPPVNTVRPAEAGAVPTGFEAVLDHLLQKDRAARTASASELLAELSAVHSPSSSHASVPAATAAAIAAPPAATKPARNRKLVYGAIAAAACIAIAAAAVLALHPARKPVATPAPAAANAEPVDPRDPVVVAQFDNRTGDASFDGNLRPALLTELQQSSHISLPGDDHLRDSLKYQERKPDEIITLPVAREIAEREGWKAAVGGTISQLGSTYIINLRGINAATGDTFASAQATATGKDGVLPAVAKAAEQLRSQMDTSLGDIAKPAHPMLQGTTRSLEAARVFLRGEAEHEKGHEDQAKSLFERAVEMDPTFAIAWARLGSVEANIGEYSRAVASFRKAYALRDGVSEEERLYIEGRYSDIVSMDPDQEIKAWALYHQLYPRSAIASNNLAIAYIRSGRPQEAIQPYRESIANDPEWLGAYAGVARALNLAGHPDQALEAINSPDARAHENFNTHAERFVLYTQTGDYAAAAREYADAVAATNDSAQKLFMAYFDYWTGRVQTGNQVTNEVISEAEEQHDRDLEAKARSQRAFSNAVWGSCAAVGTDAAFTTHSPADLAPVYSATSLIAAALCGSASTPADIAATARAFPDNRWLKDVTFPVADAAYLLQTGDAEKALAAASQHPRWDFTSGAPYIRGLANYKLKQFDKARQEFEFMTVRSKGGAPDAMQVMSMLYAARCSAALGDKANARKRYTALLQFLQFADADFPPLTQARQELAALGK